MNTYKFYQDQKVTCWERINFEVKAESYEDAVAIINSWNGEDVSLWEDNEKVIITDGATLYETTEALTPKENGGQATIEVFSNKGEEIINNIDK